MERKSTAPPRQVMVVADPTRESAGALQYALSHAVLEHDELILFFVENQNTWRNAFTTLLKIPSIASAAFATMSFEGTVGEDVDFLEEMKKVCECVQPKLRVRVERLAMEEGRDKAHTILHQSDVLGVDTIVVGQRRKISMDILGSHTWPGGRGVKAIDTADYLIENSKRTCVAVQKKWRLPSQLKNPQKILASGLTSLG